MLSKVTLQAGRHEQARPRIRVPGKVGGVRAYAAGKETGLGWFFVGRGCALCCCDFHVEFCRCIHSMYISVAWIDCMTL